MTPLHLAAWFKSSASVVQALIDAGANVNARDSNQDSPLHVATRSNPAIVPVLVKANAELNVLGSDECSPLYLAAKFDHREAVYALCTGDRLPKPHLGESPLTSPDVSCEMKTLIKKLLDI